MLLSPPWSLTEAKWLALFGCEQVSFTTFKRTFKVNTGSTTVSLTTYAKRQGVDDAKLRLLHRWVVQELPKYLRGVYKCSLKVPDDPMAVIRQHTMHNSQKATSKALVRNLYMRELWRNTKIGIGNTLPFLEVLVQLANLKQIDSKLLTPSGLGLIESGRFAPMMASFFFRASVLNPALVYTLSTKLLKGTRVFTPTLGWSSYLLGFLANDAVVEYVGVDVIPRVCRTTERVAAALFPDKAVTIHCTPSEDLLDDAAFMRRNKARFDVVFFSPPYFELELYEGSKQSTRRYPDYDRWLEAYWDATMRLCAHVMTPDARMGYIVSGYGTRTSLVDDMAKVSARYFRRLSTRTMANLNCGATRHRPTGESLLIFKKK